MMVMFVTRLTYLFIQLYVMYTILDGTLAVDKRTLENAKTAIKYVTAIEEGNCTGGTNHTLPLLFNHSRWMEFARITMITANFLTKMIQKSDSNGTLTALDEEMLFSLVRNNIRSDTIVFGSAIALEGGVFKKKTRYCPYAHMDGESTTAFDLSLSYNYLGEDVEWYHTQMLKDWSNITVEVDYVDTGWGPKEKLTPIVQLSDGHWTYPYYDCGGGNIWMVTYSLPFFSFNENTNTSKFSGITTIDIELTNIDINQCDGKKGSEAMAVDVFRGTHHCQQTTYCSPISGQGFRQGAYQCFCRHGFFFPNLSSTLKAFPGIELERYFQNNYVETDRFTCLKCSRGCDICVDQSPCMIDYGHSNRVLVVCLTCITLTFTGLISVVIHRKRTVQIFKSASPIFLQIMCLGSALISIQLLVGYLEPNDISCILRHWLDLPGFFLIYGALLLKTYRISLIFRKKTQRIHMPDRVLLKFLLPILAAVVSFLCTWTIVSPSHTKLIVTRSSLKYTSCSWNIWNYIAYAGESLFLLWGVYLSFTVRKAPSNFNESKYITWSIYNAVILGSFLTIIIDFVAVPIGPDIVYVTQFGLVLVRVNITLCLIFLPKFYLLLAKKGDEEDEINVGGRCLATVTGITTITSAKRFTMRDMAVQTSPSGHTIQQSSHFLSKLNQVCPQ